MATWCTMCSARRLGFALGLLATTACYEERAFRCESDRQCNLDGVRGTCQETGFCSYPDLDCDSGQRYEAFAGDGLADTCVEPEQESTGS